MGIGDGRVHQGRVSAISKRPVAESVECRSRKHYRFGSVLAKLSLGDQAFFLMAFIACTNDEEDISYMYDAYLQKLITYSPASYSPTCQRQGQRIKELKERAMSVLSPYCLVGLHELSHDSNQTAQASESGPLPFVSLLEFVSGIYRKEPEQLSGNDVLWTFLNFAGGDDTNF